MPRIPVKYNMYRLHGQRPARYGTQRFNRPIMAPNKERAIEFFKNYWPDSEFIGVSEDVYGPFMPSVERMLHPEGREAAIRQALEEELQKVRDLNMRYGFYDRKGMSSAEQDAYLNKIAMRDLIDRVDAADRMAEVYPYRPYSRTPPSGESERYMAYPIDEVHDRLRMQGIPEDEWGWVVPEFNRYFRY